MVDTKPAPLLLRPLAAISVPLHREQLEAQIAEAQALRQAATARLKAAELDAISTFAERCYVLRSAERDLQLLTGQLLPKAETSPSRPPGTR